LSVEAAEEEPRAVEAVGGECVVDQGRKHGQWWLTQTVVACTDIGGSRREGHAQQWEVLRQEGA
jgi:hypothetical protein